MKDMNNIDEIFKNSINQKFPYDEKLWSAVESQLPLMNARNSFWYINLNSILFGIILFSCALIPTDTVKTVSASTLVTNSIKDNQKNQLVKKGADNGQIISPNAVNEKTQTSHINTPIKNSKTDENDLHISSQKTIMSEELTTESVSSINKIKNNKVDVSTNSGQQEQSITPILLSKNQINNWSNGAKTNKKIRPESLEYKQLKTIPSGGFILETNLLENAIAKRGEISPNRYQKLFKKRSYYLEIVASRSFNLDKKVKSDQEDFEELKKTNETSLHFNSIGLNLLSNYKSFIFGIGIHQSRFFENVNYSFNKTGTAFDISYDTNYRIVNSSFNSGGNSVLLIEKEISRISTPRSIIVEDKLSIQNEFRRISIPISLGYGKSFGSWNGEIRTALLANFLYQQEGLYVNEDLNSFSGFDEGDQFNQWVFGHQSSASLGYSLNEFALVGVRFSYEYDINSFTKQYDSRFQNQNLGIWLLWKPN